MTHLLLHRYHADIAAGTRRADAAQERAVHLLDQLATELVRVEGGNQSLWRKLIGGASPSPRGLYCWGGVGRGKTYLMDLFFEVLPIERKQRLHFHRFMHGLHEQLKQHKGESDPLQKIGAEMAQRVRVLCFDEFFVSDIGDAMLLAGILRALFDNGVTLVATSNVIPSNLYRNGLQRDNFLPAIALLEKHCQVLEVDGGVDYRLRELQQNGVYLSPDDAGTETILSQRFESLCPHPHQTGALTINDRAIHTRRWGEGVAWFDFSALCAGARAQVDYIELAKLFHSVCISHVPQMTAVRDDEARRFIALVDEFYERRVKVSLSCSVTLEDIYTGEMLAFPFERTRSRLQEMQTESYWRSAHLP